MATFVPPFATLNELKRIAKEHGYRGYSRMKKSQIIDLLSEPPQVTLKELKLRARERGYRGYSKLTKLQLEELLANPNAFESMRLRALARERGYRGYSKLTKLQPEELLANPNAFESMTAKRLRALARERGLRGYSRLNRNALIHLLDSPGFYTIELEVTLQEGNRSFLELKRVHVKLGQSAAESYKNGLRVPKDSTVEIVQALFEKLDMMDWLSNRESMNPYVRIVSITSDGPPTDFDHNTVEVTDRSTSQVFFSLD